MHFLQRVDAGQLSSVRYTHLLRLFVALPFHHLCSVKIIAIPLPWKPPILTRCSPVHLFIYKKRETYTNILHINAGDFDILTP